jgi:hypothetical protein
MEPTIKAIEISLHALRLLIFNDENLEGKEPFSKGIGDTAKVKLVPYHLGHVIKDIDADEEFFHVELYPATHDYEERAEIWLAFEWKESNARHKRVQAASAENRAFREKNNTRLSAIKSQLESFGLNKSPGYADFLASIILKEHKKGSNTKVLQILNLVDLLNEFDKEDTNENKS